MSNRNHKRSADDPWATPGEVTGATIGAVIGAIKGIFSGGIIGFLIGAFIGAGIGAFIGRVVEGTIGWVIGKAIARGSVPTVRHEDEDADEDVEAGSWECPQAECRATNRAHARFCRMCGWERRTPERV